MLTDDIFNGNKKEVMRKRKSERGHDKAKRQC